MSNIKNTIISVILVLSLAGVTYFIWSYNRAVNQVKVDKIEVLKKAAVVQEKTIDTLVLSKEKTLEKQEVLADVIQKNLGEQTKVQVQIRNKIQAIDKKYIELEKNSINTNLRVKEISLERARGLWASYCIELPNAPECAAIE
jgi:membrane-associated HD superfamily phosphohydrolase